MSSQSPQLRIGELSARTGRSVHAIRWYDAQGLIPGVVRGAGGQRLFNARHISWLELLQRLRDTGMSVAQLRAYTALVRQGPGSLTRQRELLATHRDRVASTILAWNAALALIDAKLDLYGQWLATGQRPSSETVERKNAAARRAAAARTARRR